MPERDLLLAEVPAEQDGGAVPRMGRGKVDQSAVEVLDAGSEPLDLLDRRAGAGGRPAHGLLEPHDGTRVEPAAVPGHRRAHDGQLALALEEDPAELDQTLDQR